MAERNQDSAVHAADMYGAIDLSNAGKPAPAGTPRAASPSGGQPAAEDAQTIVFEATDATFQTVIDLSSKVPVVVDLWAGWCQPCKTLGPILEKIVTEQHGRVALAKVDVDANPQLAQALRAQSIPMVVAVLGGQLMPLFTGAIPEQQVRQVVDAVLDQAQKMGITGTIAAAKPPEETPSAPESPAYTPTQQAGYDALASGDFETARAAFEKAIAENPRDDLSPAALAHVELEIRLRDSAASGLVGVPALLAQADHLIADRMPEAAFDVLFRAWGSASDEDREMIRTRFVDYFTILGPDDPSVAPARSHLASLLY